MPLEAWVVHQFGGPEAMEWRRYPDIFPTGTQVLVKHTCIGVNYMDVFHRNGLYPCDTPMVPGVGATGVVEAVGNAVKGFREGDRVVYGTVPIGSYGNKRLLDQRYLIKIPDYLDDEEVAATFLYGITAHYMFRRLLKLEPGMPILIHAAAGGLGHVMCQWAHADGAFVIGTVGADSKIPYAKKAGCSAVINYTKYKDFSKIVMGLTKGLGVKAVYDGIGAATFYESLRCISNIGLMVSYGEITGTITGIDISCLASRSLFLTRPTVFTYKADRHELILSANEIFNGLETGIIRPNIYRALPLSQAPEAHRALEAREVIGQQILVVD